MPPFRYYLSAIRIFSLQPHDDGISILVPVIGDDGDVDYDRAYQCIF